MTSWNARSVPRDIIGAENLGSAPPVKCALNAYVAAHE
jgi:hypothetical protein